jgi:6-phosphogluconolactonase
MRLHILEPERIIAQAAEFWVNAALEGIGWQGRFEVALAGGRTPERLYRELSRDPRLAKHWPAIRLWFGDERCVPPEHPDSNFRMVRQAGLTPGLGLTLERMEGELEPEMAASRYAERLRVLPRFESWPQFDLVMLGMGEDGHVASLFPGSANLSEGRRAVCACLVERLGAWRLSISLPVLLRARRLLILVTGSPKAAVVAAVLGRGEPGYPASALAGLPQAIWLLDAPAAALL